MTRTVRVFAYLAAICLLMLSGRANAASAVARSGGLIHGIAPGPPTITNGPPPGGTVGVAYNFSYTSTGFPTFSLTAGALPAGLSLSSAGVISGTPSVPGTFSGTVRATNGTAPDATQNFTIIISAAAGVAIPTLSEWGLIFMVMSLMAVALLKLR